MVLINHDFKEKFESQKEEMIKMNTELDQKFEHMMKEKMKAKRQTTKEILQVQ